LKIVLFS